MDNNCEHNFTFGGVVFEHTYQLAGSGAYNRDYFNWYFCTKCLANKYIELPYYHENSYMKVQFNATPKLKDDTVSK